MPRPLHRLRSWGHIAVAFFLSAVNANALERFPPPDFESGYALPHPQWAVPRAEWLGILDVVVLATGLCLATYLVLVRRSRRGIFWLSIVCLAYLGFYRKGCVCPIGAIQNAVLAFSAPAYAMSTGMILFLVLPLLFALWAGRVFCAGVCPLGAMQDLLLIRPVRVPPAVAAVLGVLPWAYLGLAVTTVVTRGDFLICRYDPFVAFFRRSGTFTMLLAGVVVLLTGVFVGRPYCRFLCPYGILLGLFARVSRHKVSVTPDVCIRCGLCHDTCPFDAIRPCLPQKHKPARLSATRWGILLTLLLIVIAGGFAVGPLLAPSARFPGVTAAVAAGMAESRQYRIAGTFLGAFLGIVLLAKFIARNRLSNRDEYEALPAECVACGRCFDACPRERFRRGEIGEPEAEASVAGPVPLRRAD